MAAAAMPTLQPRRKECMENSSLLAKRIKEKLRQFSKLPQPYFCVHKKVSHLVTRKVS